MCGTHQRRVRSCERDRRFYHRLVREIPDLTVRPRAGVVALRWFRAEDVAAVTAACQDEEIHRWTTMIPWPYEERHARDWIATHEENRRSGTGVDFAVVDAESDELLGSLGIGRLDWQQRSAHAGYWIARPHRRRGIATTALTLGCDWLHRVAGVTRFDLVTMVGNRASERVAEKAGFDNGGIVHGHEFPEIPGRRFDVIQWALTYQS